MQLEVLFDFTLFRQSMTSSWISDITWKPQQRLSFPIYQFSDLFTDTCKELITLSTPCSQILIQLPRFHTVYLKLNKITNVKSVAY